MPLAIQVLLPVAVLLTTAVIVRRPSWRGSASLIASGGTALAALIFLIELLQLAPRARVDLLYLGAFPGADPAVRLDGLSLSMAVVTLVTAAGLMLARRPGPVADRRTPVAGWLLTTTGSVAVILAGNLLLAYIALQLLTLSWSGALDEGSRRVRVLRLSQQLADLGLLGAAAAVIHSAGTSAFAGLPSDALGQVGYALALLPAAARLVPLAMGIERRATPVFFEPAIAWLAPAGYLVLRLAALTGGPPQGRPLQLAVFGSGIAAAAAFCGLALADSPWHVIAGRLLGVQASLALAFASLGSPLMIVASSWIWLLIIPLAGLCALRPAAGSAGRALSGIGLTMLPPAAAFVGLWLGLNGIPRSRLVPIVLVVGSIAVAVAVAAARGVRLGTVALGNPATVWGGALVAAAAFPGALLTLLALPAARAVRSIPPDTTTAGVLGIGAAGAGLPALLLVLLSGGLLAVVLLRYDDWVPRVRGWKPERLRVNLPPGLLAWVAPGRRFLMRTAFGWAFFAALAAVMVLR